MASAATNLARGLCVLTVVVFAVAGVAQADLGQEFDGFDFVQEIGVSGLKSSYHAETKDGAGLLPAQMFTLGPGRVSYPNGVGQHPSPGGPIGRLFDEGVLGVKIEAGNLVVKVAGGLDPLRGKYYHQYGGWFGQGDVFVTIEDTASLRHYALLNTWARKESNSKLRKLDGGHFDDARDFHVIQDQDNQIVTSLEGHLVLLEDDNDVTLAGGAGSYRPGHAPQPEGLDYRVFAQGGIDLGDAGIVHSALADYGQNWYVQTWTLPAGWVTSDSDFLIGLHKSASCGNDQIGMTAALELPTDQ